MFHAVINRTNVDYAALLWWDFMNNVRQKKEAIQYPRFIKLIIDDLMKKFPEIPQRIEEDYHSIKDDIPLVSVYTLLSIVLVYEGCIIGCFFTKMIRLPLMTLRSMRRWKKRKQSVGESSSPRKLLKITIRQQKVVEGEKDNDDFEDILDLGSHKDNPELVDMMTKMREEVPDLVSQEFNAQAPKIIEDLFKNYVQSNVIQVHPTTTTSTETISSVDLQQKLYFKMKRSLQDQANDMAYHDLHSPKTTKERRSIRRIQKMSIRRIEDIVCEYSGRYQTWSLLQETSIQCIQSLGYAVNSFRMDDLNITMEEYIRLEEEKTQKRGKVFNWETTKYGKIWYDEDILDLRSVENEFLAIAFNDGVSSKTLSCEPTISSLNDEIDFRISFDDSDDEDYMPTISCFDDLDFFKDFENEFPAIIYNDAQTSKSDLLTEPILNPQHIDEFDLNDETSLSEYDEKEQNVLYFNDIFPFNIIHPDDLKSKKDNDDNEIDIIQSSGGIIAEAKIWLFHHMIRGTNTLDLMAERLSARMLMEHRNAQEVSLFTSRAWRRLFDIRGPLVYELILEFFSTFRFGKAILDLDTPGALQFQLGGSRSARQIPDKGDLRDYWIGISSARDFLGTAPSYTAIRDPILWLCHRLIACSITGRSQAPEKVTVTDLFYLRGMDVGSVNVPYLLARYLRLFVAGRKSGAHISGGKFLARLAKHFGLLTAEILQGLTVIAPALSVIDMAELVRLQICVDIDYTWVWVALGPKRQPNAMVGAPEAAEDAPIDDEGGQAVPTPVQAPQPLPPLVAARTMPQRLGRLEEEMQRLCRDVRSLRGLIERSMTDQGRFSTWMISSMAQLMEAGGLTYQAFDGTFRGSSPAAF
ncbi:hypothetical protein Tco_1210322 [Tanacetum coccineum]